MHRRWLLQKTNAEFVSYLASASSINPALAQILINRGIKTPEDVKHFLNDNINDLSDPFELEGMQAACDRLSKARKDGTVVMVHGDYDTDGLTATAIMVQTLRRIGIQTRYFIPNRFRDGYGFNLPSIEVAKRLEAGIILTVDCGIGSAETVRVATEAGIDVIITDHHEHDVNQQTGEPIIPKAFAVINPKLSNPKLSNLAGTGIALKMAQALSVIYPEKVSFKKFFDLAALGTLADSVPLTGENRIIVKEGLTAIESDRRLGIKALKAVSGYTKKSISAGLLSFTLVPRINAAGRIDDAREVVELLIASDEKAALEIAWALNRKNTERQRIQEAVLNESLQMIKERDAGPAIVLAKEGWHEGVVGIVASKIASRFMKPTFIFTITDGIAKGSARSIPQFDIHKGLNECHDLLIAYGGHAQAAGLKLDIAKIGAFEERISSVIAATVDDVTPTLTIDAHVKISDINMNFINELKMLEPFGNGNPEPVLAAKGLRPKYTRVVGKNHLKVKLTSNSTSIDAIGFGMGEMVDLIENSDTVDVAFCASLNEWDGNSYIQLNLKGIRPYSS